MLLQLEEASAGYGGADVVQHVSLGVDSGEVVTLLGANGAGKTTLIRALAGELRLSSGKIVYMGNELRCPLHERARQGIAVIFDDRSVIPGLTTKATLELARVTVDDALDLFPELRAHLDRRVGLLSGGQQQMLSLARSIACAPKLLVIDELSLGLAPQVVDRLLEVLVAAAGRGAGILLVEQHIHKALAVATRCYVMKRGKMIGEWSAAELRDNPDVLESIYVGASSNVGKPGVPSN